MIEIGINKRADTDSDDEVQNFISIIQFIIESKKIIIYKVVLIVILFYVYILII